jgi:hypothetical protein
MMTNVADQIKLTLNVTPIVGISHKKVVIKAPKPKKTRRQMILERRKKANEHKKANESH